MLDDELILRGEPSLTSGGDGTGRDGTGRSQIIEKSLRNEVEKILAWKVAPEMINFEAGSVVL